MNNADRYDVRRYLKAVSDLEDRYIGVNMDNLALAGIHLSLCSDGSGSLIFEWTDKTVKYPVEDASDLLKIIQGAGQTEIEFHSIEELESVLVGKGVL